MYGDEGSEGLVVCTVLLATTVYFFPYFQSSSTMFPPLKNFLSRKVVKMSFLYFWRHSAKSALEAKQFHELDNTIFNIIKWIRDRLIARFKCPKCLFISNYCATYINHVTCLEK